MLTSSMKFFSQDCNSNKVSELQYILKAKILTLVLILILSYKLNPGYMKVMIASGMKFFFNVCKSDKVYTLWYL